MGVKRVPRAREGYRPIINDSGAYQPGHPAGGNVESNVAAQWLFDEASGNIVDEVSGVTLTARGAPTYSVASAGLFLLLSPGITTGTGKGFTKESDTAELYIGTGSSTIEWWFATTMSSGTPIPFDTDDEATNRGYSVQITGATGSTAFTYTASDGTSIGHTVTLTSGWNDGNIHKIRQVLNRGTGIHTVYMDGVSLGTGDLSALAGKTIKAGLVGMGVYPFSPYNAAAFIGTLYSWRLSLNATNNSGGPGGG